jgi:hypothetical protein
MRGLLAQLQQKAPVSAGHRKRGRAVAPNSPSVRACRLAPGFALLRFHIAETGANDVTRLRLTFACGNHDRMAALRTGDVTVAGVDLNYIAIDSPAEADRGRFRLR